MKEKLPKTVSFQEENVVFLPLYAHKSSGEMRFLPHLKVSKNPSLDLALCLQYNMFVIAAARRSLPVYLYL